MHGAVDRGGSRGSRGIMAAALVVWAGTATLFGLSCARSGSRPLQPVTTPPPQDGPATPDPRRTQDPPPQGEVPEPPT